MRCFSNKELVKEINIITVAHHRGELTRGQAWKALEGLQNRCKREIQWECGRISYLTNWKQIGMVRKAMVAVFNR